MKSTENMDCSSDEERDLDREDYDIIIVGGGLTGLSAAHSIMKKRANLSLMVIEAEDSIGGSSNSVKNFELSSHFFQRNLMDLIEEMEVDVEFADKNDDRSRIFVNAQNIIDESSSITALQVYYFFKSLEEYSLDLRLGVSKFDGQHSVLAGMSAEDLIDRMVLSPQARTICRAFISLICGLNNVKNVSALWLLVMLHGAGGLFKRFELLFNNNSRYFIKGGTSVLLKQLRDKILREEGVIKYSERVTKISFNEYRNFVTTTRKIYKCSYVIIAVPPPQSAEILIETLPNNYVKTQNSYASTPIIHFEFKYRNKFWYPKYSGIVMAFSKDDKDLTMIHDVTHPIENQLKTLSGIASALDSLSQHERLENFLKIVATCFNTNEANDYLNYHEEPFDKGVKNVLRPGLVEDHLNLMRAPFNRIFFAASEYASKWPGTADGAVEAGEYVACLVLYHARPQSLDRSQIVKNISSKIRIPESNFQQFMAGTILLIANTMTFWYFLRDAYKF